MAAKENRINTQFVYIVVNVYLRSDGGRNVEFWSFSGKYRMKPFSEPLSISNIDRPECRKAANNQ